VFKLKPIAVAIACLIIASSNTANSQNPVDGKKDVVLDSSKPVGVDGGRIVQTPQETVGRASAASEVATVSKKQPPFEAQVLSASLGDLGLYLMKQQSSSAGGANRNQVVSPFSVASALGMLYSGAVGQTAQELGRVLDPASSAGRSFVQQLPRSIKLLSEIQGPRELIFANRLWINQSTGNDLNPTYAKLLEQNYKADGVLVNFSQPEPSRQAINLWVDQQTKGVIKDILPSGSVSPSTRFVVTNAVYFKGQWATAFEKSATRPMPFKTATGTSENVPTMVGTKVISAGIIDNLSVFELPYEGGNYSLVIAMAPSGHTLQALESDVSGADIAGWRAGLKSQTCQVFLPKFKIDPKIVSLKDAMRQIGVEKAFSQSADFSAMVTSGKSGLALDNIFHAAGITVDEEGTEAAAATAATVRSKSLPAPQPQCKIDRPFVFALMHKASNTPLFVGKVANPSVN
jgi:serpin B